MNCTLPIKENRDFKRLYYRGKSIHTPLFILYLAKNRVGYNRLGLTASTKLGCAVVRNRCKRLMREAYRLHESEMKQGYDLVIVARFRMTGAKCKEVEKQILKAAHSLHLLRATEQK